MSVKRYDLVGDMDGNCNLNEARMELSDDGVYVKYSEHLLLEQKLTDMAVQLANAESKCRELAVESAKLKDGVNKAVEDIQCFYDSDGWHVSEDGESETAVVALDDAKGSIEHFALSVKTPATDAFLAEVRAQGVDDAIDHISKKFEGTGHIGVPVMALELLAQEIRKGAAQ